MSHISSTRTDGLVTGEFGNGATFTARYIPRGARGDAYVTHDVDPGTGAMSYATAMSTLTITGGDPNTLEQMTADARRIVAPYNDAGRIADGWPTLLAARADAWAALARDIRAAADDDSDDDWTEAGDVTTATGSGSAAACDRLGRNVFGTLLACTLDSDHADGCEHDDSDGTHYALTLVCGMGAPRYGACTLPPHAGDEHERDVPADGQHYAFTLAMCRHCNTRPARVSAYGSDACERWPLCESD